MAKGRFQARRSRKRNNPDKAGTHKRRGAGRWFAAFFVMLAFLAAWVWIMEVRFSPVVKGAARDTARDVATLVLSESVERQLSTMPDAEDLIETRSGGANVRISQLDFTKLTDFQHRVEADANNSLDHLGKQTVKVPLAQLLGASWLSPVSAEIPVHISLSGRVHSTLDVMTRPIPPDAATHVVYLKLTARVRVQTPFQSKPVTARLTAPVTYFTMSPRH